MHWGHKKALKVRAERMLVASLVGGAYHRERSRTPVPSQQHWTLSLAPARALHKPNIRPQSQQYL